MAYSLSASQADEYHFFWPNEETAAWEGFIGYMRADFGSDGSVFWHTWFNGQEELNRQAFKDVFKDVIDSLREDGEQPPLSNRRNLRIFCSVTPGKTLGSRGCGYELNTEQYAFYFRCQPSPGDYDVYCFAYDKRRMRA